MANSKSKTFLVLTARDKQYPWHVIESDTEKMVSKHETLMEAVTAAQRLNDGSRVDGFFERIEGVVSGVRRGR